MKTDLIVRGARVLVRGGLALLLGTLTACVMAAGCSSSSPRSSTTSRTSAGQDLAFSVCMRSHGVSSFPDPGATPSGPENMIGGVAIPSTINMQAPAFRTAWTACRGLLSSLSPQGRPQITASMRASLIAHAQCMRAHGVSGYQDPTFPAGGGIAITDAGTNPQSPAYQRAAAVCGKL